MSFDLWTLGFQAINVLVLVWLLHRFFWKPVAAMTAARQAKAATLLQEADTKRAEAMTALAEVEATREGLASERETILVAARKDAESARDTLLAEARAEAADLQDTAKAAHVRAAEKLKKTAIKEAQALALTIAGQLAARLNGRATDAAFLGWLVEGISALPKSDRLSLSKMAKIDMVSATEVDAKAQNHIAKAVTKALGSPATLAFRVDPELIAGYELHSPHFTLRNSWAADLARIAAGLADGEVEVLQPGKARTDAA